MELIFLFFLYYLAQNPNFTESMKPILGSLKNSEELLKFMSDLSKFSEIFSSVKNQEQNTSSTQNDVHSQNNATTPPTNEKSTNQSTVSATKGIADDFIEKCLSDYFKNR